MDQIWAALGAWLQSLDWGSVPDWFAAVGTVGALFLGLGILLVDRGRVRRSEADAFSTWYVLKVLSHPKATSWTTLVLKAHNAGALPVPVAVVRSPSSEQGYTHEFLNDGESIEPIGPGQTFTREIEYKESPPDFNHLVVQFMDGKGRRWFRGLVSGKYMSERRAVRLLGTGSTDAGSPNKQPV